MSFQHATSTAPADADFIAYKDTGVWVVVQRRSDGVFSTIANTDDTGFDLIAAGISASRKSLWNAETGQFICGTVGQLSPIA